MQSSTHRFGLIERSARRLLQLGTKGGIGFAIIGAVFLCALFAPWIAPHDPNQQDLLLSVLPPAWSAKGDPGYFLGTDRLGQDILSRIIYGSRVSLITACPVVIISGSIGTLLGLLAGYFGRIVQHVIMRLVDVMLSVPFILLALVVLAVLGPSQLNLILAFVVVRWVQYTRIAFGQTLEVKERDFIVASKACGASHPGILLRHILPNILSPLLVIVTLELGFVILMESGLSFLGLGTPPEIPSWGGMLQEGRAQINIAWWLTTFPGLAIALTVTGFNFVGDWLRDRLDPRTKLD
jgi:peptide/nickel transport system permease protein